MAKLDFGLEKIMHDNVDNARRLIESFKYLNEVHGVEDPVTLYNEYKKDFPSLRHLISDNFSKYESDLLKQTRTCMYKILDNDVKHN